MNGSTFLFVAGLAVVALCLSNKGSAVSVYKPITYNESLLEKWEYSCHCCKREFGSFAVEMTFERFKEFYALNPCRYLLTADFVTVKEEEGALPKYGIYFSTVDDFAEYERFYAEYEVRREERMRQCIEQEKDRQTLNFLALVQNDIERRV